jgi:hypothetical protein
MTAGQAANWAPTAEGVAESWDGLSRSSRLYRAAALAEKEELKLRLMHAVRAERDAEKKTKRPSGRARRR